MNVWAVLIPSSTIKLSILSGPRTTASTPNSTATRFNPHLSPNLLHGRLPTRRSTPGTQPRLFIAASNNEDPGINTPAETLFQLYDDFAGLALGLEFVEGADIGKYRMLVPAMLAQGVESCLKGCWIKRNGVE